MVIGSPFLTFLTHNLKMGKVMSMVFNPFRNFNVESRAQKVISQAKPTPAPKYKSDLIDYERIVKDYPQVYQESLTKHGDLDKHLKDVFVVSRDDNAQVKKNPNRPLPLDKSLVTDYEYGFKEPKNVPLGKVTLKNALKFISDHQADAQLHTVKRISEEYLLPEKSIKNILDFYRVFEIYVPLERKTKAKFAGAGMPKVKIIKEVRKQLESGTKNNKDET